MKMFALMKIKHKLYHLFLKQMKFFLEDDYRIFQVFFFFKINLLQDISLIYIKFILCNDI